jgi:hypothetical protein
VDADEPSGVKRVVRALGPVASTRCGLTMAGDAESRLRWRSPSTYWSAGRGAGLERANSLSDVEALRGFGGRALSRHSYAAVLAPPVARLFACVRHVFAAWLFTSLNVLR